MKIVEDFIEGNSRKSQAYEQHLLVSIYNSRLKSNVLIIIEGFRGKRAYIAFLADFHFLQDRANFWQTDLF